MTKTVVTKTLRSAFTAISLATLLMATPSPAHAGLWSWWRTQTPSWWSFRPRAVPSPEIDAGLARSAAAIIAGGLVALRSRKKRQG